MANRGPSKLNLLLAVDKPVGCTSHDVVSMCRRALGERRVGHAGTLDPLASGVMLIGVGQATRLLGMLTLDTKSYIADIVFGSETNTDDAEGEVVRTADAAPELFDRAFAGRALAGFLGRQEQVPPAFSAISVNGVRAYRAARAGEEVELPPRPIEVLSADLIAISGTPEAPVWTVAFTVSKGTYIRALARDIGRAVSGAAHIGALRRTSSGSVSLGGCIAPDALDVEVATERALDPVATLGVSGVELSARYTDDILCGRRLPGDIVGRDVDSNGPIALVIGGELRALARLEAGVLVMSDVFPQGITGVRL